MHDLFIGLSFAQLGDLHGQPLFMIRLSHLVLLKELVFLAWDEVADIVPLEEGPVTRLDIVRLEQAGPVVIV